jgi:hypothetical protein
MAVALTLSAAPAHKTTRIVWVMTDGLRWQEVFQGAELAMMTKENGVPDVDALRKEFWRDAPEARREALFPFLWSAVLHGGQIYGNRNLGSDAFVTNGFNFSYPGYNESLTGAADPRIDSNEKKNNPNVTVLEWLAKKRAYRGKVAAFAAWDAFPFIFNADRAGFSVNAGFDPFHGLSRNPRIELMNQLKADSPRDWDEEPFDNLTFYTALEYVKQRKPRVLYLSLGETDEWAHQGKYAEYLRSAHRVDSYLKILWETIQSMREYRGVTTLVFSPDHGRGESADWRNHGQKIPDSKDIWMAFLGPDTAPLGERSKIAAVTQSQLAGTIAALLGEDYHSVMPDAGAPIVEVLPRAK